MEDFNEILEKCKDQSQQQKQDQVSHSRKAAAFCATLFNQWVDSLFTITRILMIHHDSGFLFLDAAAAFCLHPTDSR